MHVLMKIKSRPDQYQRLVEMVNLGHTITTDYSGIQCPEMAIEFLHNSLKAFADVKQDQETLHLWHFCDYSKTCQKLALKRPIRSNHIFQDLNDRLPKHVRDWMDKVDPAQVTPRLSAGKAANRYCKMREYLKANAEDIYKDNVSWCIAHKQQCPVQPPMEQAGADGRRRTRGNIAGTTCVGWSARGLQRGDGDISARPFWIWGMEKQVADNDWVFHECTVRHPLDNLKMSFPHKMLLKTITCDPKDLGWPVRRPRTFVFAMNQETLVWTGPDFQAELQDDFATLFHTSCCLDGNAFFLADDEELKQEAIEKGKHRGIHIPKAANVKDLSFEAFLAPGARLRKLAYEKESNWSFTSVADLEQWPQAGGSIHQTELPCLVTHGTLWSWQAGRWMTFKEHLVAQGIPVYPSISSPAMYPMQTHLCNLSSLEGKRVAGNGIHLNAFGAFYAYCMSNCVPRDMLLRFTIPHFHFTDHGDEQGERKKDEAQSEQEGSASSGTHLPAGSTLVPTLASRGSPSHVRPCKRARR